MLSYRALMVPASLTQESSVSGDSLVRGALLSALHGRYESMNTTCSMRVDWDVVACVCSPSDRCAHLWSHCRDSHTAACGVCR